MKTVKLFTVLSIFLAFANHAVAQKTATESFAVSGNCGMCKSKIEKAAKEAGATYALWDADKKQLTVKYSSSTTNTAKIQQKIADAGYDNAGFKSTAEAYSKLPGCCKYDRATLGDEAKKDCCKDGNCSKEGHDGKTCCNEEKEQE